jgi:dual specificity tyrosine-phosphorylation-regulated kinase 2/3/4
MRKIKINTGKACKIDPKKTPVKKRGILSLTLNQTFSLRRNSQSIEKYSVDLPLISSVRANSISYSIQKKETPDSHAYNPISQVQAIPLTPSVVLKQFSQYLTKFEVVEIQDYPEIHFLGMKANKTKPISTDTNFGYDDERFYYKIVIGDHLSYRYEVQQIIGKGSYGQVCMCFDHKFKTHVAIKIIRSQAKFHKQGRIEVKVLSSLKDQCDETCTVAILDHFIFRKHLCISFELLSANLYELLKTNGFHGFSQNLIKKFAWQLLLCLKNLKEKKIIHCDLKPENILLRKNPKNTIKVIDFGSSCYCTEKIHLYLQSRFYRAPEVILGINYSEAIDMWSLGCILAELHIGYPLFPGESETDQLLCIMEIKGVPPDYIIEKATKKKQYFDNGVPKIYSNTKGKKRFPRSKSLHNALKNPDEFFLDFLDSNLYLECFEWDPESRITPLDALNHPWLQTK